MSTPNPLTSLTSPAGQSSVTIIGHSPLFYWWPVWAVGFLMAFLTYLGGNYMAVVPAGTVAEKARHVQGVEGPRDVLILPANRELATDETAGVPEQPGLRVARSNSLGSVFVTVLLLVILITNVRLSGVWPFVLIGHTHHGRGVSLHGHPPLPHLACGFPALRPHELRDVRPGPIHDPSYFWR